ncbi:hypothetical protein QLH32_17435 [Acinetobacter corruptisaponis]|uniref:Single-stranded DNA-binding protein n=1 Tax=Acinetobacter corruptisaponis TaxID=3045147 RepID=A0ABY8S312_9GAMM|nr:hypothetical protein [Acinetobacter sp. KCTC 92772]WHP05761.1 hypothetical protein QLH32_17435 [Acinetobacter sp. KCTC 92772]
MNYQTFNFNQDSAKQADNGGRIEQAGKYIGVIKSMEFVTSRNTGTTGFEINFETDSKESATISIWTQKNDGTPLSGSHKINALLACAGVRALTPTDQPLEKYDYDTKQRINQRCVVAPEMTGKRIGLLLQRENYKNGNGQSRHRMNFFAAFHAGSELMAKELIDKKTVPEALPKALERLMQNPVTDNTSNSNNSNGQGGYQQQSNGYGQNNHHSQNNGFAEPAYMNQGPSYDDGYPF